VIVTERHGSRQLVARGHLKPLAMNDLINFERGTSSYAALLKYSRIND